MTEAPKLAPHPRANPDLIGHQDAESVLLRAACSKRLPHAWLLTGPRGIGKATLAYRFARYLLSGETEEGGGLFGDAPRDLSVPSASPVFRQVSVGAHPDLLIAERSIDEKSGRLRSEIVIQDVREVSAFLHHTAAGGGWRVVIVDAAEEMNRNAANALLKSLEEPPRQAVLILVSHTPGQLLPTIRSRCCALPLRALDTAQVDELLHRYAPDMGADERSLLSLLAEGSIGRALTLATQGGAAVYRELLDLLGTLPELDIPRVHAFAANATRGRDIATFRASMELLAWSIGRLVRTQAGGGAPVDVLPEELEVRQRLAGLADAGEWLTIWRRLQELSMQAEWANLDPRQVLVSAFAGMSDITAGRSLE